MIPITFLTGFYVSEVVRRYWDQFLSLPYPDRLALKLVAFIPGKVGTVSWKRTPEILHFKKFEFYIFQNKVFMDIMSLWIMVLFIKQSFFICSVGEI